MKRALLGLLLCAASLARAGDEERPVDTDAKWAVGRVGSHLLNVSGRGHYTQGDRDGLAYTQGGGEIALEGGGAVRITSFGSLVGFDFDVAMGLTSTEVSSDGTLRDARDDDELGDPAKLWFTGRLGARLLIAPVSFGVGGFSARIALLAGFTLEGNGARSWEMPGAMNIGGQLVLGTEGPFALHAAYLGTPRQGEEVQLIRHQVSLDVGLGPLVLGARWQLDDVTFTSPAARQTSHGFFATVGVRFVDLTELD